MTKLRITACLLALLACLAPAALAQEDEEVYFADIPQKPHVTLSSPAAGQTYGSGGTLTVRANGEHVERMEITLTSADGQITETVAGAAFEKTYTFERMTAGMTVAVTGYTTTAAGHTLSDTQSVTVLSPREKLIEDMFGEALKNSTDRRYRFAPAQEDYDVGVCKNFVMRLFDTFKDDYAMLEYPELELHMPKNNSKVNCAPYDYGIEWRIESAADGSPFEIAAQFKYDSSLTKEENWALCQQVLHSVQKGDFFQMVGYYIYGNGPHSLLFMTDYDPLTDELHFTDSNMKGERVDGVRWGYLQYDAVRTAEWFVEAVCMKNRGCTLYRLRDDLFVK